MKAVLFDLDGTLIDSAPQLVGALNQLRQKYDLPPIPFLKGRPFASHGAAGLLKAGFDMDKNDPLFDSRIEEFLEIYKEIFNQDVQCMEGIEDLIEDLILFYNFENGLKACIYRGFQRFLKGYPQSYPQLLWISKKSLNIPKLSPKIGIEHQSNRSYCSHRSLLALFATFNTLKIINKNKLSSQKIRLGKLC